MLPFLLLASALVAGLEPGLMVTPEWLKANLKDPQVRVICVAETDDADYARGHIPGARLLDHMQTFVSDPQALARVFARAGASDGTRVVLYGNIPSATAWEYSALASIGFNNVSWLDGGLPAWRAGNRPVETTTPPPGDGPLTPRPAPDLFVDAAWVRAHLNSPSTKILDVRSKREWQGGHLPNATLIAWQDLFSDSGGQKFKSPQEIRDLLASAGVRPDQEVVTYCQMGMRASLMSWAARVAGVKTRIYLGSWQDWSKNPANPVVR